MSDTTTALDALNTASKRVKIHDAVLPTKLPAAVKKLVIEQAEGEGVSSSTIVRIALAEYFEKRGIK